jgi:hypothetical protein
MSFMARILTAVLISSLAVPTAASAALRTIAPPGDSAVSQYVESVPTANGQRPTVSLGDQASPLTPSQRQTLDRGGVNGRTLAAVVDATSPGATGSQPGRGAHAVSGNGVRGSVSAGLPPDAVSGKGVRSPVSSMLAAAVGSGGGMGILLPALMLAVVLGVVAGIVLRRRRTP